LNTDAGPDFSNARIRIGETTWAGNIELHIRSSDWYLHGHDKDKAYDNVILHVVMENDRDVFRLNGEKVPVVSLKGKYDKSIENRYRMFMQSRNWIACQSECLRVRPVILLNWLERMAIERLEDRSIRIHNYLQDTQYDWEQAYFQMLCRNFGFKTNTEPFEMLGRQIPLKLIRRNSWTAQQTEAILFGQAGFLTEKHYNSYHEKLRLAYEGIKAKYQLMPLPGHIWKFMRLRPANFPTVRIAQLAAILQQSPHLLRPVLEAENLQEIKTLYNVTASDYWITHYHFNKPQTRSVAPKKLGNTAIELILINTAIPFLFVYGKFHNKPVYQDKALDWLMQLPAEKNHITKKYRQRNFPCEHALHSQALLQLRHHYCSKKKCLQCHIGHALLSGASS
ncbi:MAG: DUF2851 family protein, partial [Bacteroidales bacterium]